MATRRDRFFGGGNAIGGGRFAGWSVIPLLAVLASLFAHIDVMTRAYHTRLQRRVRNVRASRSFGLGWLDAFRLSGMVPISGGAPTDLETAAADLDATVLSKGGDKPPEPASWLDRVSAFVDRFKADAAALVKGGDMDDMKPGKDGDDAGEGMIWLSGKKVHKPKEGVKVAPDKDSVAAGGGDMTDKSQKAAADLVKSEIDGNPDVVKAIDAAPAIAGLADTMMKGFALMAKHVDEIRAASDAKLATMQKSLDDALGGIALGLQGSAALSKAMKEWPVRPVMPGFLGTVNGKQVAIVGDTGGEGQMSKSEIFDRVYEGVQAGEIPQEVLPLLDGRDPQEALRRIPADVAQRRGIPIPGGR